MLEVNSVYLLGKLGMAPETVIFLLFLPIVVTIIGFAKYIIGVKSLGIYSPIILTFMFFQLGLSADGKYSLTSRGLFFGIITSIVIFIATFLSYKAIEKWTLHYYAKLSIVITGVVIALISVLMVAALFDIVTIVRLNVFSLILIATLAEQFMNLLAFKNTKNAFILSFTTIIIAMICYITIGWSSLQSILVNLPANYLIGSFKGLRLSEYIRFRDILEKTPELK
jgi:hypothetical protein